ncbi:MAG: cation-translocating P-type ATPase [Sphingomonas sp.]|jgi:Ca2+-transporting ATPase|uniref:cation-translocating P-type ATPase n=1 Tax=Sphingomonas sp. TaxID=28214 RepID=UPI0035695A93
MALVERQDSAWRDGLTAAEAAARLAADGPNELPRARRRSPLLIAGEVLREPMLALLLGGAVLYLILGDHSEALILGGFACFSITVTIVQEVRTEHVLEALRDISAPRALVVRDGVQVRVAGRDVVRGDLLLLQQGDRIAADATLIDADSLEVDESLLTGESLPVAKLAGVPHGGAGTEDPRLVFSGSLVTHGNGTARTIATGHASRIGQIGRALATLETEAPRLRREMAVIVRLCALGGAAAAVTVVLLFGFLRGGWIDALLAGIAIGMSLLPEEFPVVLTIFLAMGAWRIGQARVLTRRAAAIEALGSATVLCTDKTGTLTENRMRVAELWTRPAGSSALPAAGPVPDAYRELVSNGVHASPPVPADPMEIALQAAGRTSPVTTVGWSLVRVHGLTPELLAVTNVWETGEKGVLHIAAKGAPEAIAQLCRLSPADDQAMMAAVQAMAAKGIRVLGVAMARTRDAPPAAAARDYDFSLVGLIGLADPLRAGVPLAVERCRAAGIRVLMITGDHAATARSIARQAGIAEGEVMTGAELASLDDAGLDARLDSVTVFARIQPEQKLRIVTALKRRGEIVAMTGDGVNDAPSLKAAHIGIAMGGRGTDVAREAAAIVLLDDDFGSIVDAVRLGRRIYDNIRKAIAFIFAVHVPIAGLALLPLLLGLPILFAPIHIAFLEMIIDPVCALVFEAEREEADVMRRAPRRPDERLLNIPIVAWAVFQGGLAFLLLSAIFVIASTAEIPAPEVRGLTFFALIASILALILVNRSFSTSIREAFARHNIALRYVLAVLALTLAAILAVPGVMRLFGFSPLTWLDLTIAGAAGLLLLALLEATKKVVPGLVARMPGAEPAPART